MVCWDMEKKLRELEFIRVYYMQKWLNWVAHIKNVSKFCILYQYIFKNLHRSSNVTVFNI